MMNYGAFNERFTSSPLDVNPVAKARQRVELEQDIKAFLATGGQILRYGLIKRDMNGKPMGAVVPETGQAEEKGR